MYHVYIMQDAKLTLSRARDDARTLLRTMVLSGEFAAGARIEEVELAARIGVSRTPVREALIALEQEGLVRSRPHRGFVVVPADAALVRETYPVLAALEGAALRLSWTALRDEVGELKRLNDGLADAVEREKQYALDQGFHEALTRHSGNARLQTLLDIERARARRFDGADDRGTADRDGSCEEHARIVQAIARDDMDAALKTLDEHWRRGTEVVVRWLAETS